jgi:3-deoxy-D-manno-octulosonic-acid transferase
VPVFIVNGRLSDRALRRTLRFRRLYARALERVWVGAQSDEHAARYLALGAIPNRVLTQGNLKYDLAPPHRFAEIRRELERLAPAGPLWVAGSVREGEEEAVAEAAAEVRAKIPGARLILAPRHQKRARAFAGAVERRGLTVRFRTDDPERDWDVLVLDTVGELWPAYDLASAAFVGGSLAPLGGQNVLEPAFLGKPVVFGPSTENFREEAERLAASGGGFRVESGRELSDQIAALLADPETARAAGLKAREVVLRHTGSVERTARWIAESLPGV